MDGSEEPDIQVAHNLSFGDRSYRAFQNLNHHASAAMVDLP